MSTGMSDTITIELTKPKGIAITCGTWYVDHLTWDEAIGTLAAMLVRDRTGHLRLAMDQIRQGIRYERGGINAYFGGRWEE